MARTGVSIPILILIIAALSSMGSFLLGSLSVLMLFMFWDKTHDLMEHFRDVVLTGLYLLAPLPAFLSWRLSGRGLVSASVILAVVAAFPALWWLGSVLLPLLNK
jgi:hypothetical protein